MEPTRALVVKPVTLGDGVKLRLWTYVWKLAPSRHGFVSIEHRNRRYQVPTKSVVDVPVPPPPPEHLSNLDPCFLHIPTALQAIYRNESKYFTVHLCPHGSYFLEDVRGGSAMFSLWIFLGAVNSQSAGCWESNWAKFHYLPVDAVFFLGIGC